MNLIPYAGNQYGLKFPVLCDGYVSVDYSDTVATEPKGIWKHEGSFTVEMLFIPYEINGYGSNSQGTTANDKTVNNGFGNQTSQKSIPSRDKNISTTTLDIGYMPVTNRLSHRMCLFSSTNLKIYLINKTTTNENQPSEYYIEVQLTTGAASTSTVRTGVLFKSKNNHTMSASAPTEFIYTNNQVYLMDSGFNITFPVTSGTNNASRMDIVDSNNGRIHIGQNLYKADGTLLGTVTAATYTGSKGHFTLDTSILSSDDDGEDIYIEAPREVAYTLSPHHIGVSYNRGSNSITIFYNGSKVANGIHTDTNVFTFGNADITLGQDRTSSSKRYSQFMGELHEVAVLKGSKSSINTINTLLPQFNETLLYIDFEEADI